jgi:CBS domain-containing protein
MYEFLAYRVKHVMTRQPTCVDPEAPLADAERIFAERDFNALPVCRGDVLVGVLTKLDALRGFAFAPDSVIPHYDEIASRPVESFMTAGADVDSVDPELPLTRVLERMIRSGHKSLPVVDGGHLVGIVAREDVLGALARASRGEGPEGTTPEAER